MTVTTLPRVQRCAIYTRRSFEGDLDREFNSIESQRDICAAYITCQHHRGWARSPQSYDDAGQSGATLYRPALQRLLRDVERSEIDIVVIYKLDRLTRSLADFIRLIQVLDHYQVKFVSVTQSFDTSDSMGRLILNILLTFAQFERELLADRIRDKVAAIKRRGKVNGGRPPFGYDMVDRRLVVNPVEADLVRSIFRRYLEIGSSSGVTRWLIDKGIRAKIYVTRTGEVMGGGCATNGMVMHILKNPTYVGRVPHNGDSYPGEHQAIVDLETWEAVQALIVRRRKFGPKERQPRNILKGLLSDSHGRRMIVSVSGKKQFRYYESAQTPWLADQGIKRFRMRAERLEELVVAAVREALENPELVRAALREIGRRGDELDRLPGGAVAACEKLGKADVERLREMLRSLIAEGEISQYGLTLVFRTSEVARFLAWDGLGLFEGDRSAWSANEPTFTVRQPLDEMRFGRAVVMPVEPIPLARRGVPRPELVKLIQLARRAQAEVDGDGGEATVGDLARRFRCSPARFCRLLRLNYLAPDIVAAILAGAQPAGVTHGRLVHGFLPLDWDLQRRVLGFPRRPGPASNPSAHIAPASETAP
jgi:DNA invertase Pin-like site-specific DNA recombinase